MSFPALFLACQAAEVAMSQAPEDEEFGLTWSEMDAAPDLTVRWAMYRSENAGVIFGVLDVRQSTFDEWLNAGVGL